MQLNRKDFLRILLTTVGAIIVGALGSGVWQHIMGPLLGAVRNWVLDVASLGLESYKRDVYAEIARGLFDAASVRTLDVVTLLYAVALAVLLYAVWERIATERQKHKKLVDGMEHMRKGIPEPEMTLEEAENELIALDGSLKRGRRMWQVACGLAVLLIVARFVSFARTTYIHSAVAHYYQALRIASPYIQADERLRIESQFSQIQSREEYISILEKLTRISKEHGQSVPAFDAW